MSLGDIVTLIRDGIFQILILVAPVLGAALIIGLIVAIFQATTSIQEQTLTFAPKFFVILGVIALLGGWMFTMLRGYTVNLFEMIPQMGR
ncbi:flagellar biosynthesis protein FliQ [Treponema brennaborense]|uniref:Flagellar biosynthetic protein FliQ n=1 Tax=Treponema brennaborense (strain DSM 12168 / CIP 105900 / DD5/3) TaxID=906968 RepID=F4LKW9_TREBD|nr:flagellar biosynthesis protein FliQ [Treponema brennaborense]AEE16566.1 flagellar biosynthetic protein FliQ [Treponema brennaborense DSM 12168]